MLSVCGGAYHSPFGVSEAPRRATTNTTRELVFHGKVNGGKTTLDIFQNRENPIAIVGFPILIHKELIQRQVHQGRWNVFVVDNHVHA